MRKKRKEKKEIDKGQEKKGKNIQEFFKRSLQELKRKKISYTGTKTKQVSIISCTSYLSLH